MAENLSLDSDDSYAPIGIHTAKKIPYYLSPPSTSSSSSLCEKKHFDKSAQKIPVMIFFLVLSERFALQFFCRAIRAPSRNLQDLIHEVRCPRVCHGTERNSGDSPVSIDSFQRESARNPMSTSFSLDLPLTPRCLSLFRLPDTRVRHLQPWQDRRRYAYWAPFRA